MKSLTHAVTISCLKYNIFLCLGLFASWFPIPWWGQAPHTKTISLSVFKSKIFPMVILPGFVLVHTFQVQSLLNFPGVNNFLLSTPWSQFCTLVLGSCLTSLGLPLVFSKNNLNKLEEIKPAWNQGRTHQAGSPTPTDIACAKAPSPTANPYKLHTALHLQVPQSVSQVLWLSVCLAQSRGCLPCCVEISNTEMLNVLQSTYSD